MTFSVSPFAAAAATPTVFRAAFALRTLETS